MSVLNPNSDDEPQECPLCMEFLELDDINFYPCSCGYQVSFSMFFKDFDRWKKYIEIGLVFHVEII